MANVDLTSARVKAVLPNLLLATTYALNKSNTKRAIVGLDYAGGLYKPVVKLCSSGSPSKYVTFDAHCWELILDQLDVMTAFFQNSYAFYGTFGNPSRVFMPNLDIIYKSSYGSKSICFEERPASMMMMPLSQQQQQQQRVEAASTTTSGSIINNSNNSSSNNDNPQSSSLSAMQSSGNTGDSYVHSGSADLTQPPCKKKRYDTPPSVTIQEPTFIGLKDVRECIATRMNYLNEISVLVNRMIDHVILYLHQKLSSQEADKVKNILRDTRVFAHFFKINYVNIHAAARKGFDSNNAAKDQTINILLLELVAFGLPWTVKHVTELVQKS